MSSLIRSEDVVGRPRRAAPWLFAGVILAAFAALLLAPGGLAHKSHALLHGLCAQRPSHSIFIGGDVLPLDARMTGIYLGAAVTSVWLVVRGRLRSTGRMPSGVLIWLAVFVALMAVDGFNALLFDLRMPHAYAPTNVLRFITGSLAGTTLGVTLCWLFAITVWRRAERNKATIDSPYLLAAPILATWALGGLAMTGLPTLYAPFAVGLLAASIGVFWMLATVLATLLSNRAWTIDRGDELVGVLAAGLVMALAIVGLLAGFRFAAEAYLGLPKLT